MGGSSSHTVVSAMAHLGKFGKHLISTSKFLRGKVQMRWNGVQVSPRLARTSNTSHKFTGHHDDLQVQ